MRERERERERERGGGAHERQYVCVYVHSYFKLCMSATDMGIFECARLLHANLPTLL